MIKGTISFNRFIKKQKSYLKGLIVTISSVIKSNTILNPTLSLNLTHIIQGALNSPSKYVHASTFSISFLEDSSKIKLRREDNGIGLILSTVFKKGSSLKKLNERVTELDRALAIKNEPGSGSVIVINF